MQVIMGIVSFVLALVLVSVAWLFWHFSGFFITVGIVATLIYGAMVSKKDAPK